MNCIYTFAARFFHLRALMTSNLETYSLVYSLQPVGNLGIYLPVAHICENDKLGHPGYPRALALLETIESYGIHLHKDEDKKLFAACLDLSEAALRATFIKKGDKKSDLQSLFADDKLKKTIRQTIDRKLADFLHRIHDSNAFLCFDLQRKTKAIDVQLLFFVEEAKPKLKFTKTQLGIKYELALEIGTQTIRPCDIEIITLADNPGIVIIQNHVVFLSEINANKLSPFAKKDSVFIENKTVLQYFQVFILDLANKVDAIDVEGFDLIRQNDVTRIELTPFEDFIKQRWALRIQFVYQDIKFLYAESIQKRTRLKTDGDVSVFQSIRNQAQEKSALQPFLDRGWQISDLGALYAGDSHFDSIHRLGMDADLLANPNILLHTIQDGNKTIIPATIEVFEQFTLQNDWFDIHGVVRILGEDYPFEKLIPYIKDNNPYFKLNDGRFVIIPSEIMATYGPMASKIEWVNDKPRLAKVYHNLLNTIDNVTTPTSVDIVTSNELIYTPPSTLQAKPRPYQIDGIKWLIAHRINGLGACLADDMGLGKTLQTIAALLDAKASLDTVEESYNAGQQLDLFAPTPTVGYQRSSLKALIVLPASLVFNWEAEIKQFAPSLLSIKYVGQARQQLRPSLMQSDIILTTYQTVLNDIDWLKKQDFYYVILDESQYIRNRSAKIFGAVNSLNTCHKLSLSGTPIENGLADLWSQMEFINPSILGSFNQFKKEFEEPIVKHKDEDQLATLKQIIEPYILRRTKKQVAKDLPDIIESIHYSDMDDDQIKIYEEEKSKARNSLLQVHEGEQASRMHVLASITRLRQIASHPVMFKKDYKGGSGKFDDILYGISEVVNSGNKVLVFSSFTTHLGLISTWLKHQKIDFVQITGDSTQDERKKAVNAFESNEKLQVFLISIKAGGTGLNLTSAGYVFILDPWWNPKAEDQAIARAHRIGQTKNVIVTRYISRDTIDEKIMRLKATKQHLADSIIDVEDVSPLSMDDLSSLLEG